METEWRVGVLRPGEENTEWTASGTAPEWAPARAAVVAALRKLAAEEGCRELWLRVGDVSGIVQPGLDEAGNADLHGLGESLPTSRP